MHPESRRPGPQETRPPTITPLGSLPAADADRTQARCTVCGHPIHKPSSVSRGTGPVCAGRVVDLEDGGDRG